jgi:shikimate kinase
MDPARVNLYLVGFMGTGKTTVGRGVAQKLGFRWMDSDHEVERIAHKPIASIFADEGEAAFRSMERAVIADGHPSEGIVMACGGGLVVQPGMLELLRSKGVVICLHASIETILARAARHGPTRPLLAGDNPEAKARALYAEREPIYRAAGTVILTDSRPLADVVAHVIRVWRREAAMFGTL